MRRYTSLDSKFTCHLIIDNVYTLTDQSCANNWIFRHTSISWLFVITCRRQIMLLGSCRKQYRMEIISRVILRIECSCNIGHWAVTNASFCWHRCLHLWQRCVLYQTLHLTLMIFEGTTRQQEFNIWELGHQWPTECSLKPERSLSAQSWRSQLCQLS